MAILRSTSIVFFLISIHLSVHSTQADDWKVNLQRSRLLQRVGPDSNDDRGSMKGSGSIAFQNDRVIMDGRVPRYYVEHMGRGWQNMEMIAYVRLVDRKSRDKAYSGFTMVARSDHARTLLDFHLVNSFK